MKAGSKGGGRNALPRMGFHHFYHLYRLFSPVDGENITENFRDSHRKFPRLHFRTAIRKKNGKGGEIGEDPSWVRKAGHHLCYHLSSPSPPS